MMGHMLISNLIHDASGPVFKVDKEALFMKNGGTMMINSNFIMN
jgi:hypothetical protein